MNLVEKKCLRIRIRLGTRLALQLESKLHSEAMSRIPPNDDCTVKPQVPLYADQC